MMKNFIILSNNVRKKIGCKLTNYFHNGKPYNKASQWKAIMESLQIISIMGPPILLGDPP